jgi:phosphoglycerate kinase
LETAARILERHGDEMALPVDVVIVSGDLTPDAEGRTVSVDEIPSDGTITDIGPKTVELFKDRLDTAKMVVWNGPLGVAEMEAFAEGTNAIARVLADLEAATIVGGGETGAVVRRLGIADRMTHVSTGGGAFLSFLEGKELPAVAALNSR